jgi:hypothetical protein
VTVTVLEKSVAMSTIQNCIPFMEISASIMEWSW